MGLVEPPAPPASLLISPGLLESASLVPSPTLSMSSSYSDLLWPDSGAAAAHTVVSHPALCAGRPFEVPTAALSKSRFCRIARLREPRGPSGVQYLMRVAHSEEVGRTEHESERAWFFWCWGALVLAHAGSLSASHCVPELHELEVAVALLMNRSALLNWLMRPEWSLFHASNALSKQPGQCAQLMDALFQDVDKRWSCEEMEEIIASAPAPPQSQLQPPPPAQQPQSPAVPPAPLLPQLPVKTEADAEVDEVFVKLEPGTFKVATHYQCAEKRTRMFVLQSLESGASQAVPEEQLRGTPEWVAYFAEALAALQSAKKASSRLQHDADGAETVDLTEEEPAAKRVKQEPVQ